MDIHVYFHVDSDLKKEIEHMSQELDALTEQVKATTDVEKSALLLIESLAEKIEAAKNDPNKLVDLSTSLRSSSLALAQAIQANTPAGALADAVNPPAPAP